jgi:hypothetical protein
MTNRLENGAKLPPIHAKDLDDNPVDITETVAGRWAAVLFYRGHW